MDDNSRKTALRTIPCGILVLTTEVEGGDSSAATVNRVTKPSLGPQVKVVGG